MEWLHLPHQISVGFAGPLCKKEGWKPLVKMGRKPREGILCQLPCLVPRVRTMSEAQPKGSSNLSPRCAMKVCYDLCKCGMIRDTADPLGTSWVSSMYNRRDGGEGNELNDCVGSLVCTSFVKWTPPPAEWAGYRHARLVESKFISRLGELFFRPPATYICMYMNVIN